LGYFVGTSSNPADFTLIPSTITALNAVAAPVNATGPVETGYIAGGAVTGGIPGVTTAGAPVSFEILAWVASGNGAGGGTYATSGYIGSFIWTDTFNAANIGASAPAGFFQNLTGNAVLNPVPEPTSLALAGLGGLASLMAFRRKKA
ncbi:MAG TPA: PEP-CTERM sorting domain-containing protein, partial [Candidatus Paceibacterota bacterium]|nr:PEP-CTERM sorting domain-containing protein [Candidatus Paceibacterota bacterium]